MNAKQVARKLYGEGSIYAVRAIHPDQIEDEHLASMWRHARLGLDAFEAAENEICDYLAEQAP